MAATIIPPLARDTAGSSLFDFAANLVRTHAALVLRDRPLDPPDSPEVLEAPAFEELPRSQQLRIAERLSRQAVYRAALLEGEQAHRFACQRAALRCDARPRARRPAAATGNPPSAGAGRSGARYRPHGPPGYHRTTCSACAAHSLYRAHRAPERDHGMARAAPILPHRTIARGCALEPVAGVPWDGRPRAVGARGQFRARQSGPRG